MKKFTWEPFIQNCNRIIQFNIQRPNVQIISMVNTGYYTKKLPTKSQAFSPQKPLRTFKKSWLMIT